MDTRAIIKIVFLATSFLCVGFGTDAFAYSGGTGTQTNPYKISTPADWQQLMNTSAHWNKYFILTADVNLAEVNLIPVGNNSKAFTGVFDGNSHIISNAIINMPSNGYVGLFGFVVTPGKIKNLGIVNVNIAANYFVGGIIGYNYSGSVINCYSTGYVNGNDIVGGLVGYNCGSITISYSRSSANGGSAIGGLVGFNDGSVATCYSTGSVCGSYCVGGLAGENGGSITSCYSISAVSGLDSVGGLVGYNDNGSVKASFWDRQTSGLENSAGGKRLSTIQMKLLSIFRNAGWGSYGWVMADGIDYPRLNWEATGYPAIPPVVIPLAGNGTEANPYQIWTPADFTLLSWYPDILDRHVILMNDIDATGQSLYPIGDNYAPFAGVFDGNGHIIHNADIKMSASDYVALFGYIDTGSQIKNLGIEDANITGCNYVGGLVGSNFGSVTNCFTSGSVNGNSNVGGLVGRNVHTITSCYSKSSVTGKYDVGGLVGFNDYGNITACYSIGLVTGIEAVYGLVGYNNFGSVSLSFWDKQTSGQNNNAGGNGLTTTQMKMLTVFRDSGWGSYDWVMADGIDYPRLSWEITEYPVIPPVSVPLTGSGTESDPYQIWTPEDFALLGSNYAILDKYIILMNDIDVRGQTLYAIGDLGIFTGVFDGNNHTIRNPVIDLPSSDYVGLFKYLGSVGQIKNLGIADSNITGRNYVGGLVGKNNGTVTSCFTNGFIDGNNYTGGLVGLNYSGSNVTNCYSIVSVDGNDYVGVLIGQNDGSVTSCFTKGGVNGNIDVGGLTGGNGGNITSSYSNSFVNGSNNVGGLVGLNSSHIISCYSSGLTIRNDNAGGLVGYNDYNFGSITTSFWDRQTSGQDTSSGGTGLTTLQMKMLAIFRNAGWGSYNWVMADGIDYPRLSWEATGYPAIGGSGPIPLRGSGTESDPYQIWTSADFAIINCYISILDKHIILMNDIDVGGQSLYPIGNGYTPFNGVFDGNNHIIYNASICFSSIDYVGLFGYVGANGQIKNFGLMNANIKGHNYVGSIAGQNTGHITSCFISGEVNGYSYVGGLTGQNDGSVTSCYSMESIDGNDYVGGFIGQNDGNVTSCYSIGPVSGADLVGGLIGQNNGRVKASFWDMQTSGQNTSAAGKGLTTIQMKTLSIFYYAGWGTYGWVMADGIDYPRLNWEVTGYPTIPPVVIPLAGSGTDIDPYQIKTPADFALLSLYLDILDKRISLMNDIDTTERILYPIGESYAPFTGIFDGKGHNIRNAVINMPSSDYVGLFGFIGFNGQIKNLGLTDANITGRNYVGGLTGENDGSVTNCFMTGSVDGNSYVGGLVGYNNNSVTSCYSKGQVIGINYGGGLTGYNSYGRLVTCYSSSSVIGNNSIGGFAGYNVGMVINCYSTGSIDGNDYVGGLVGENNHGQLIACYSKSLVRGTGLDIGGFIGVNDNGFIRYSFWDTQTSCQSIGVGVGSSSGIIGKTTAEMKTKSTFIPPSANWDFSTIWAICERTNYPRLKWQISKTDWVCPDGVEYADVAYFSECWLSKECELQNNNCTRTDLNNDGNVDFKDFALFAQNWLEGI